MAQPTGTTITVTCMEHAADSRQIEVELIENLYDVYGQPCHDTLPTIRSGPRKSQT